MTLTMIQHCLGLWQQFDDDDSDDDDDEDDTFIVPKWNMNHLL